jgi:hypothetical protein
LLNREVGGVARRRGIVELAVSRELKALPLEAQRLGLASLATELARMVDQEPIPAVCARCAEEFEIEADGLDPRDLAALSKELRATLADLASFKETKAKGGKVDDLNARRQARRSG